MMSPEQLKIFNKILLYIGNPRAVRVDETMEALLDRFIQSGGNIDARLDTNGKALHDATILIYAAHCGNVEAVKMLLAYGAQKNLEDFRHNTALNAVISSKGIEKDLEIVEILLSHVEEQKPGMEQNKDILKINMLTHALQMYSSVASSLEYLTADEEEKRSSYEQAKLNKFNIIKTLLDNGIDVNLTKENMVNEPFGNLPPVFAAVWSNKKESVELLLSYGANIECEGGQIPKKILSSLVDLCPDHTSTNVKTRKSSIEMLKFLLENKIANINAPDSKGQTVLHTANILPYASKKEDCEIMQILLDNGGRIDIADNEGKTPLHIAATQGRVELTKLLAAHKVDNELTNVDLQNEKTGDTALHYAIKYGQIKAVKVLLAFDADINISNNGGVTPLSLASEGTYPEIKDLLLSYNVENTAGLEHSAEDIELPSKIFCEDNTDTKATESFQLDIAHIVDDNVAPIGQVTEE